MTGTGELRRRLTTSDAVSIGLGSMLGAGVFSVWGPAAQAAGVGLLVGLAIAAVVAFANATSSAQLAMQYPRSGGSYLYGRERLGPWPGFLAGWAFVIGKTASCAAMALTAAAYLAPAGWERPVAAAVVLVLAGVNALGITRTAAVTQVLVVVVLAVLVLVVAGALAAGDADLTRVLAAPSGASAYGVLQSAGLLFFAFAGYARIATLAEEVRDPARTLPRAVVVALTSTLVVYVVLAVLLTSVLGVTATAASTTPLVDLAAASGWSWTAPVVVVGAAAASLGALLALLAGVSRTGLAMARHGDLPGWFAVVEPRTAVPRRALLVQAAAVALLVLALDLRGAIGFSSFGVLVYYLVANAAALTQQDGHRRYPRLLQVLGVLGCTLLVVTLPWQAVVAGAAVLGAGVLVRLVLRRRDARFRTR